MGLGWNGVVECGSLVWMLGLVGVELGGVFGVELDEVRGVVVVYGVDFMVEGLDGLVVVG